MSRIAYQALGYVTWRGVRWYARRRLAFLPPARWVAAVLFAGGVAVAFALRSKHAD